MTQIPLTHVFICSNRWDQVLTLSIALHIYLFIVAQHWIDKDPSVQVDVTMLLSLLFPLLLSSDLSPLELLFQIHSNNNK